MFVTKKFLPRRTFLQGMGVAVSLPLLDAMVPAFTALARAQARPRTRFGAIYVPNGAIMEQWIPERVGAGFEFKPILKPLETFQDQVVVVSNLTRSHPGSQVGDHAVSAAGFLTGVSSVTLVAFLDSVRWMRRSISRRLSRYSVTR